MGRSLADAPKKRDERLCSSCLPMMIPIGLMLVDVALGQYCDNPETALPFDDAAAVIGYGIALIALQNRTAPRR